MPSDLFKNFGKNQPTHQANAKDQALNLMKQQGIAIPEGMENNPQALIQHVMQSGAVPQNRLSMAQQIMQRIFKK